MGCNVGWRGDDGINRGLGWYRFPNGSIVGGTYARIFVYSPYVNSYDVSAWSMLANNASNRIYAQVGWLEKPGGERHTFIEQQDNQTGYFFYNNYPAQPVGQYHYYTTLWGYHGGKFTYQVDGNTIQELPAVFNPNLAVQAGENQTSANQMPGGTRNNEVFANSRVYINGWQDFDAGNQAQLVIPNPSGQNWYNAFPAASNQLDIYDFGCAY